MLGSFELHRPATVEEAAALLAQRPEAALYAGGTELLLLMKSGLVHLDDLIDLKRIPDLGGITADDAGLTIGATVTHRTLERSTVVRARCPLVAHVAGHVANVRVRNVGTVGGNLAFADPHSDLATLFLAFDATVHLVSAAGARELSLAAFVRGSYETERRPDELLAGVRLRAWPPRTVGVYAKFGLYERPTLGLALALTLDDAQRVAAVRLAVGCVSPRPHRLEAAERALMGRPLASLAALAGDFGGLAAAAIDPTTDLHGSVEYKRDLTRVFARRALAAAVARAQGTAAVARYPYAVIV